MQYFPTYILDLILIKWKFIYGVRKCPGWGCNKDIGVRAFARSEQGWNCSDRFTMHRAGYRFNEIYSNYIVHLFWWPYTQLRRWRIGSIKRFQLKNHENDWYWKHIISPRQVHLHHLCEAYTFFHRRIKWSLWRGCKTVQISIVQAYLSANTYCMDK